MDMKLELVAVPVTDVDRAKKFYVEQVGFHEDHDHKVTPELRFVQLTPPGSACSIVIGTGTTEMAPGSQKGLQVVVSDIEAVRQELAGRGDGSFTSATPTATRGRRSRSSASSSGRRCEAVATDAAGSGRITAASNAEVSRQGTAV